MNSNKNKLNNKIILIFHWYPNTLNFFFFFFSMFGTIENLSNKKHFP